eukprot:365445-Chlamydomonas_euryale.AAC.10
MPNDVVSLEDVLWTGRARCGGAVWGHDVALGMEIASDKRMQKDLTRIGAVVYGVRGGNARVDGEAF